ncbi:MAG: transglycosylase SLT domain-containing protein [Methylophilus sp.]|uniref:lytic transglycosylase domain-containing protein n=1 Tax=Methylophilus sp. TaxID=29541 RepID=UPI003FA0F144
MQVKTDIYAARQALLLISLLFTMAYLSLWSLSSYADEAEVMNEVVNQPAEESEIEKMVQASEPEPSYSREQSKMQNDGYKQFIKLQTSLASGTKNALGLSSYEQAYTHYCALAGDAHNADAQFAMGWFYSTGKGVEVNHDIAARFFSLAAIQGHRDAREWLDKEPGDMALAKLPACMHNQENSAAQVLFRKRGPVYQLVKKHAPVYGVDVDFAMAVIAVESGFNPKATSRKKAQGLMQLLPDTQARFHVKDAYDPEQNIKGGLSYLRWLIGYFKGDVELVAAAYNAGENAVQRHQGIPPYPETRNYVKRIAVYYKKKHHEVRQKSAMRQSEIAAAAS